MKKALALLLSLCMVFTLFACGAKTEEEPAPAEPGDTGAFDITACIASEPETIDPNLEESVDAATYILHMFEGLMKYVSTGEPAGESPAVQMTKVDYGMASSYDVSEDGLTYTFHLRDDAVWSDGEPVTANDFVYSWQRLVTPASAADYGYLLNGIVLNATEIYQDGTKEPSELGVKAVDEKTFEVTLVAETPYFIELCAFAALMPLRQDVVEAKGTAWTNPENIVVNGAFILSEWVHDSYIKMVPNEKYYDAANLGPNSITWYLSDSETAILAAYQTGEYNLTTDHTPTDQIATMQASGDLFILHKIGTYYLYLSAKNIPDWRVRAAITLAIDRENLVKNVTQAGQTPATGLVPAGITDSTGKDWLETNTNPMYARLQALYPDYDLTTYTGCCECAQALLAEAEADGFDATTSIVYNFNTSESHKKIAEAVQADVLSVLGLNLTLANQDWNVYTDGLKENKFGLARLGWIADYNDASTYLEMFMNGNSYNYGQWINDSYTTKMNDAKKLSGGAERDKLLFDAENEMFSEEGFPIAPLYFYTSFYCLTPGIQNVMYTPFGYYFLMYATQG